MNTRGYRVLYTVLSVIVLALGLLPTVSADEGVTPMPYGSPGPYPVGAIELKVEAPLHPTKIVVWYPAVYPEGQEVHPGYPLYKAAPDPSGGPYPLVIYVPGLWMDRRSGQWIADHLASYGFVVTAMDPIDVQGGGYTEGAEMLRRPQDVVWQLDYTAGLTAEGGSLEGMIDMDRVAVTGHSMGGYTALMTAGARLDWAFRPSWCADHFDSEVTLGFGSFCDLLANGESFLAPLAGLDPAQPGLWPSWGDSRVDAVVSIAPPFWIALGPQGMANLTAPLLVMGGGKDTIVPPDWDLFYEGAGSAQKALVIFDNGDHTAHLLNPDCTEHFVTAFLLTELMGDSEAAAALAQNAVNLPGITYEAQGF